MKQHISGADEQMSLLDRHPASLCNTAPTPTAITAHAFYDFFLCVLPLYVHTLKPLNPPSQHYPWRKSPSSFRSCLPIRQTKEKTPSWTVFWPGCQTWRSVQMQLLISHESHSLNRTIINSFFPELRHQISFITLKISVPLLNLIEMGNGFQVQNGRNGQNQQHKASFL